MEPSTECQLMLEHFGKPAFLADRDAVVHANAMAAHIGIAPNTRLTDIFGGGADQNPNAVSTVSIQNISYTLCASGIGQLTLFTLEQTSGPEQLQSLQRAAQQLRIPLAGLASSVGLLTESAAVCDDEDAAMLIRRATKHLYALQRTVRNMSDVSLFLENRSAKKEPTDAAAFIRELCEKLTAHFADSGVRISCSVPDEPIHCSLDRVLLERAVYNMVSNSLKAASRNITITLSRKGGSLSLCVEDDGCGIPDDEKSRILSRFKEDPVRNMQSYGLGLGMMIVFAAAAAHNGTILISDAAPHGCRITVTIAVEKPSLLLKQTPASLIVDPLGGTDPLLLELADILPPEDFL